MKICLNSFQVKRQAELDMLIDLGRNDLKRVYTSGIEMTSYRHVEKVFPVMHTISCLEILK